MKFLEQIMYAEQLISEDFGVSTSLFDAAFWNNNRYYYINVENQILLMKYNHTILISVSPIITIYPLMS
jgi:hypothetical protein